MRSRGSQTSGGVRAKRQTNEIRLVSPVLYPQLFANRVLLCEVQNTGKMVDTTSNHGYDNDMIKKRGRKQSKEIITAGRYAAMAEILRVHEVVAPD